MTLRIINPVQWRDKAVPEREWIVRDLIPARAPTLLYGDGAAGKTTIGLQLAGARALERDWIGTIPKPGRTLFLSAEDDEDELHRRMDAVRRHYGATWDDLAGVDMVDLVGESAILGQLTRAGLLEATPLFQAVEKQLERGGYDLVIVDALADAFAGEENNRSQARQFIGMLKRPARTYGCAFLCLAHPSLTGMNTGSGMSGSTAWSNSVRARLYFEAAKASDGSEPDPELRTLSLRKANYAASGWSVNLRWKDGVYVPEASVSSLDRLALDAKAQDTFRMLLRMFNSQGQDVSAKPSSTYAPTIFAKHPKAEGIGKTHFARAMQELLDRKEIEIEVSGPPSKPRSRLVVNGVHL